MRKKLPVLSLVLIILMQAFAPVTFAASKNEAQSQTAYFCPSYPTSEGAGNAVKSYVPTVAELRAINPARSGLQTHHILPEYLGKQLGYTSAEMANHPGTLIPQYSHTGALNQDAFHKVISSYLKPGVAHTPGQIASGLEKAYTGLGRPELFNVIRDLIK